MLRPTERLFNIKFWKYKNQINEEERNRDAASLIRFNVAHGGGMRGKDG